MPGIYWDLTLTFLLFLLFLLLVPIIWAEFIMDRLKWNGREWPQKNRLEDNGKWGKVKWKGGCWIKTVMSSNVNIIYRLRALGQSLNILNQILFSIDYKIG